MLFVDLERREHFPKYLPVGVLRSFLSGRGANMFLLHNLLLDGRAPLDPQIPMIFGDAVFPTKIQTSENYGGPRGRQQRLVWVVGQFASDPAREPGNGRRLNCTQGGARGYDAPGSGGGRRPDAAAMRRGTQAAGKARGEVTGERWLAAGLERDVERGKFAGQVTHLPRRKGTEPVGGNLHPQAVVFVAADGGIDLAHVLVRRAVNQRDV